MLFYGQITRLLNRHQFHNKLYYNELKDRLSKTGHINLTLLEKLLIKEIRYLNSLNPPQEPIVLRKFGKRDDF